MATLKEVSLTIALLLFGIACSSKSANTTGTPNGGSGGALGTASGGRATAGSSQGGAPAGGASAGQGGAAKSQGGGATSQGGSAQAGTTAQGGSGGAPASQGGSSGATTQGGSAGASTDNSVLERNHHPSRDGAFVQPTLTKATAATLAKDAGFTATFTGNTWASPLYLENGPGGKGAFFTVTNGNDVFALDETSGAQVWKTNIGTPAARTGQSCGDITPIGIISTPVIDAAARTIYVAGAIGNATSITEHQIHALSVDDGSERTGFPINLSSMSAGGVTFSPSPQNQRSALSLVGGILYVAYGGHNGDCGTYRGWVVAVDTKNPTSRGAWVTGGTRGEAIWAAGGMASDGNGIFAITGNNLTGTATHADSEEVVRLTGLATLTRTNQNLFYPSSWRNMDSNDADFGASSPVYLASPVPRVAAVSKDGHFYLLDATNLGGMGAQLADLVIATGGSMIVHTAPAAYVTSRGAHVVFTTNSGAQCPAGGASGKVVMSVLIPAGSPPQPSVEWCVATSNASLGFPASPMVTTTDGSANPIVWFMDGNRLIAVDGESGASIYDGGTDSCSGVHKWTAPIAVKGRVVVAGDTHLCSWSAH